MVLDSGLAATLAPKDVHSTTRHLVYEDGQAIYLPGISRPHLPLAASSLSFLSWVLLLMQRDLPSWKEAHRCPQVRFSSTAALCREAIRSWDLSNVP